MKGNSGIFLQSIYEVQVLDGEDNPTYVNGMVGSIYKQQAPAANAFTGTEKWQVYDIYWKAPRFGTDGKMESPAMVTVVLNGILIQNNYILKGNTPYIGFTDVCLFCCKIMVFLLLIGIFGFVIYKSDKAVVRYDC